MPPAALKHYTFLDYATQGYVVLVGFLILFFHNSTVPNWPQLLAIHLGIIAVVHGLVLLDARLEEARSGGRYGLLPILLDFLRHFYPILLFAWFYAETGLINRMFFPAFFDPQVIRLEAALFGCQPSILFMEKLPYQAVSELFYAAYFSYYLMIGGVGFALFFRNRREFSHYVSVVSFLFYLCYLIYIVFPVIGPPALLHPIDVSKAFHSFAAVSEYPPAIQKGLFFRLMVRIYAVFETPGAALPSSHVAIAVCTLFFSFKYLKPIRYWHLAATILLCLSTVYCRYHYGVDVLAGLATAALVIPVASRLFFRFSPPPPFVD